uniref:Uncharacterized protein n=1 Tax=Hyaloperonospora arabidopsidis (strain Emoy2) TaxID=559515 RepID=M4B9H1_HYAAE
MAGTECHFGTMQQMLFAAKRNFIISSHLKLTQTAYWPIRRGGQSMLACKIDSYTSY